MASPGPIDTFNVWQIAILLKIQRLFKVRCSHLCNIFKYILQSLMILNSSYSFIGLSVNLSRCGVFVSVVILYYC